MGRTAIVAINVMLGALVSAMSARSAVGEDAAAVDAIVAHVTIAEVAAAPNEIAAPLTSADVAVSAVNAAGPSSSSANVSRIVSLVPSVTETLFALGIGARVVGVSTDSDFPAAAAALPEVGTFGAPVAEAIAALTPDLVLTSPSPGNHSAVSALQRAGVRVVVVGGDGGIQDVTDGILDVARATGEETRGKELVARIDAELVSVRRGVAGLDRPAVAVAVGREPLILAGPSSYLGELITVAGGSNIAGAVGGRWPRVGLEFLVQQRPEVILDLSVAMERAAEPAAAGGQAEALERWANLGPIPAVASRRVYGADRKSAAVLLRPGPRLAEAARLLAARLHPGIFPSAMENMK